MIAGLVTYAFRDGLFPKGGDGQKSDTINPADLKVSSRRSDRVPTCRP
ncbi:MAG: hypothetical protein U1F77_01320 [Kiritimatiellia bacterium]